MVDAFSFACRTDCGLCCYATPAVTPPERERLIQLLPELTWQDGPGLIPARPLGGACQYLADCRCRVHDARPFPCSEFPLSVHLGPRAQASVVLSCPGLSLEPLEGWSETGRPTSGRGLEAEKSAVLRELSTVEEAERGRIASAWERAIRRAGGAPDLAGLARLRDDVRFAFPEVTYDDVVESPLPEESDGLETLPIFFDPIHGRVALADADGAADLLAIREGGGVRTRLASLRWPERLPRCSERANRLLRGYLEYLLDRDAFVGAVLLEMGREDEGDLVEAVSVGLSEVGGTVLARSYWRAQLAGASGESLDFDEVAAGIRATDADYLDRPTAGRWL